MNSPLNSDYKHRYAIAKHHAWAGSILLAILGALRWFVDEWKYPQKDYYFIIIGTVLVIYILIALFFTYRYRSGLSFKEKTDQIQLLNTKSRSIDQFDKYLSAKEQAKIEKKRAKNQSKQLKKMMKAIEKQEKE